MTEKEFLIDFFENKPPYKECDIPDFEQKKIRCSIDFSRYTCLNIANVGELPIESFCLKCNKLRTFTSDISKEFQWLTYYYKSTLEQAIISDCLNESDVYEYYDEKFCDNIGDESENKFVHIIFTCTHCGEKHHFSMLLKPNKIRKIGQYPTYAKSEATKYYKYKNLKEIKKYYTELTQSLNAYSQDMGIAAFVYLRRIFEHLVNTKYTTLGFECEGARFADRLAEVEKNEQIVPTELYQHKHLIYKVLSKGVHEYEENECKELYPFLLGIIEMILDQELVKKEKEKKIVEMTKVLERTIAKK